MGIEKTLKRAEVFLGLDDNELNEIAALPSSREDVYHADEVIFRAGDEAKYLYVLREGQVDLVTEVLPWSEPEARQIVVDSITKGGFFGWSALVRPHFYVMSAICKKPCTVAVISGVELTALFDRDTHLGYTVLQSLCRIIGARLRDVEQLLIRGERWPFFEKRKGAGV